jgi:peptide/nickel transport system substrate-binding protein
MLRLQMIWLVMIALAACWGCTSGSEQPEPAGEAATNEKPKEEQTTLLEPFTPPTLAELEAKVEWVDQSVLDAMGVLREDEGAHAPLVRVPDALKLENNSPENNTKILSSLGRLPTEQKNVDWDGTINRRLIADIKTTNPLLTSSHYDFEVRDVTALFVLAFDWTFKLFGDKDIVVSWQTSKDHLYDKIVLRDDLTWSDGKPVTAHDVAFSFKTILDTRVAAATWRTTTKEIRWVEAYDDHTLIYFHKQALSTNLWNIYFPIVPKHIYEKTLVDDPTMVDSTEHVRYEDHPVTGGPYKVISRKRGQETVVERREEWYTQNGKQVREKPFFKRIRFRVIEDPNTGLLALKAGEVDESMLMPEQWKTQTNNQDFYSRNTKVSGVEWVYCFFGWNMKGNPFFGDIRVRKAMSYAFDYQEMLEKHFYGVYEPCNGIFYHDAWMAPKEPLPYYHQDLPKAEALLDEAGWIDHDGDGVRDKKIDGKVVPFEFTVICGNMPERVATCALLKEDLEKIGVICNVRPLEFTVMLDLALKHNFQAELALWGTGTDPDTTSNLWATGEGRNYCSYSNPEVDRLYEEGRKEFDREKRAAIYAKIDELIYADQPYTFLYFRSGFYGFNKKLRGYKFSPRGPYLYDPGFSSIWMTDQ